MTLTSKEGLMMGKIKTSKKGIIAKSEMTGNTYRVFKWEDLGDGKIACIEKIKLTSKER